MYTAFMVAITLTTVANVLVTMASRRCSPRWRRASRSATGWPRAPGWRSSWPAPASPGCTAPSSAASDPRHWSAPRWRCACRSPRPSTGRCCSTCTTAAATTRPTCWRRCCWARCCRRRRRCRCRCPLPPRRTTWRLLGLLGVVQLAIPCLLAVRVARVLSAPEMSLLACSRWCSACSGSGSAPTRRRRSRCSAAARWCWARWPPTRRWRCGVARRDAGGLTVLAAGDDRA